MLEMLQMESREVNREHQSPQLDQFAAYKDEDARSSSFGIHEPVDYSKLLGYLRSELFHHLRFFMFGP